MSAAEPSWMAGPLVDVSNVYITACCHPVHTRPAFHATQYKQGLCQPWRTSIEQRISHPQRSVQNKVKVLVLRSRFYHIQASTLIMFIRGSSPLFLSLLGLVILVSMESILSFSVHPFRASQSHRRSLSSSPSDTSEDTIDYEVPDDAVVIIKPKAMKRLRELKAQQDSDFLVLRMGVRNGGCSGLSYVMDFANEDSIEEDDAVDEYASESVKCVIDAKSVSHSIFT